MTVKASEQDSRERRLAMAEQIGHRVVGTIKSIKGTCSAGHRVGDSFELGGHTSAGLCGFFYHGLFSAVLSKHARNRGAACALFRPPIDLATS